MVGDGQAAFIKAFFGARKLLFLGKTDDFRINEQEGRFIHGRPGQENS